jgi:invasion protein IalB
MSGSTIGWNALRRVGRPALLAALALGLALSTAVAQQIQDVPKMPAPSGPKATTGTGTAPAPSAPKATTGNESSWVKICTKEEKSGGKQVCLVRYEGLDPKTGAILIAAAVRNVEGENEEQLLVNVPTGYSLAIPPGVQIKIDDGEPIQLQYSVCLPPSCQVQTKLSKEILGRMRKGQQIFIAVMNGQGKTMMFPISLKGFSKTADGPPVDNRAYQAARSQMIQAAHERQRELAKEAAGAPQ